MKHVRSMCKRLLPVEKLVGAAGLSLSLALHFGVSPACVRNNHHQETRFTGWGKSRFTVVSMQNTVHSRTAI